MNGWSTNLSFWDGIFSGAMLVYRSVTEILNSIHPERWCVHIFRFDGSRDIFWSRGSPSMVPWGLFSFTAKRWGVWCRSSLNSLEIPVMLSENDERVSNHLRNAYCWWKKSCTSWQVIYPIIYKVFYIPSGAGFLPSTVVFRFHYHSQVRWLDS